MGRTIQRPGHRYRFLGLLATLALGSVSVRAADSYTEDAVKAAYLYRFSGYVTWPEPLAASAPFIVDVVGAPGVATALRTLLRDHPINGHAAVVREVTGAGDWGTPQMIYAGNGHADKLRTLVSGAPPTLIVTDQENGLSAGSVVNLLTVDRNIRFEISLTAANRRSLKVSSELLGVALRVEGGRQ